MKRRDSSDTFSVENIKRGILVHMTDIQAKRQLVTIIGASNRPHILDETFVRRFSLRLYVPPPDTTLKMELLKIVLDGVKQNLSDDDIEYLANDRFLEGAPVAHMTDVIHTLLRDHMGLLDEAKYFDKVNDPVPFQIALLTSALEDAAEWCQCHRPIPARANFAIAGWYRPLFLGGLHA